MNNITPEELELLVSLVQEKCASLNPISDNEMLNQLQQLELKLTPSTTSDK